MVRANVFHSAGADGVAPSKLPSSFEVSATTPNVVSAVNGGFWPAAFNREGELLNLPLDIDLLVETVLGNKR